MDAMKGVLGFVTCVVSLSQLCCDSTESTELQYSYTGINECIDCGRVPASGEGLMSSLDTNEHINVASFSMSFGKIP